MIYVLAKVLMARVFTTARRRLLKKISTLALLLSGANLACGSAGATADAAPTSGVSIPVMSKVVAGNLFYYVRLRIGDGPETNVILDTGSIGLRAIAAVVPRKTQPGRAVIYSFESGSELHGHISNERVNLGGLELGILPVHVVETLRCNTRVPDCSVAKLDPSAPFAQGIDGRSDPAFGAIMGIRLFTRTDLWVPNPLKAAGIKRWIVQLPRSPSEPGALVLDPPVSQLNDFTRMKLDKNGTVMACLESLGVPQSLCLPTIVDSGDPHFFVFSQYVDQPVLAAGAKVRLAFSDSDSSDHTVVFKFAAATSLPNEAKETVRYDPAVVSFRSTPEGDEPFINSGYLPFLSYSILFDADNQVIGMRARTPDRPVSSCQIRLLNPIDIL